MIRYCWNHVEDEQSCDILLCSVQYCFFVLLFSNCTEVIV